MALPEAVARGEANLLWVEIWNALQGRVVTGERISEDHLPDLREVVDIAAQEVCHQLMESRGRSCEWAIGAEVAHAQVAEQIPYRVEVVTGHRKVPETNIGIPDWITGQ
jgi:hypothetical protein